MFAASDAVNTLMVEMPSNGCADDGEGGNGVGAGGVGDGGVGDGEMVYPEWYASSDLWSIHALFK